MGAISQIREKPLEQTASKETGTSVLQREGTEFCHNHESLEQDSKLLRRQPGQRFESSRVKLSGGPRHTVTSTVTCMTASLSMGVVLSCSMCSYLLLSTKTEHKDLVMPSCQHQEHSIYNVDNDGNSNSAELELTFLHKTLIAYLEKCKMLNSKLLYH